jgi:hypothetical protein
MSQDKPTINVTSNNQQGGITAYQVNIGRIYLSFTEDIAVELTRRLPKDRPIDLRSVGSQNDQQIAAQYAAYLQKKGYGFRRHIQIGMMGPPPNDPITIIIHPDHSDLVIAPRA